jgi:hypothetical protein
MVMRMTEIELFLLTGVFFLLLVQILIGASLLKFYRIMGEKDLIPEFSLEAMINGGISKPAAAGAPGSERTLNSRNEGAAANEGPAHIETITGKAGIGESLNALCEKYGMESFTLAGKDGLVIASSANSPDEEAAHFSYLYTSGIAPHDPMMRLFTVEYNDQELVGIARLQREIPDPWLGSIAKEATDILMWWL